jgi:phosphoribulokinase
LVPENNLFPELEALFRDYAATGMGKRRKYLHDTEEAAPYKQSPGTFTPWEDVPADTDLLFYEGLHGAVVTPEINIAQHPDLLIGVVPVINLEWIQKLYRDKKQRGYSTEAVTDTILRRMPDYVNYICPQFMHTHVNFQRVPMVDTSNPFIARDIPSADESMVVIRFSQPKGIDFQYLLNMIDASFMSRANTIVVPGGKMELAMQLIFTPFVWRMMDRKKKALPVRTAIMGDNEFARYRFHLIPLLMTQLQTIWPTRWPKRSACWRLMRSKKPSPATLARPWAWPTLPRCCGTGT